MNKVLLGHNHSHSFMIIVCGYFCHAEAELKIFITWPFTEKLCRLLMKHKIFLSEVMIEICIEHLKSKYFYEKQTHRHREQTCGCQGGQSGSLGLADTNYYREWINNKVLLYSTGNSIQYSVITYMGKELDRKSTRLNSSHT